MIKLTQLLSELDINNPNITVNEVWEYMYSYIYGNSKIHWGDEFWKPIWIKYAKKYRINDGSLGPIYFKKLSQSDLNKLYNEMKQLVKKHNINELEINRPVRTWDFSKHIPNFDPKQMIKGDRIINYDYLFNDLIFDEIDEVGIHTYRNENNNTQIVLNYDRMLDYNKLLKSYGKLHELEINRPTLNIHGEYGDVQYFANSPLKGTEIEILEVEDNEEYKVSFHDNNGEPPSPLFPQILDLHDYGVLTKWLKQNNIPFHIDEWSHDFSGENGDETEGVDLYIAKKHIKFITDESI